MPSTMIHLLLAYKLDPDASGQFFLGSFAPDAVDIRPGVTRADKDEIHLRLEPDRWAALEQFAKGVDVNNPFQNGYLAHLFMDAHWDRDVYEQYGRTRSGPDWFASYREEMGRAGLWLFHNLPWSAEIWRRIGMASLDFHNPLGGPSDGEIRAYAQSKLEWHQNNRLETAEYLKAGFLHEYTDSIAKKYMEWIKSAQTV